MAVAKNLTPADAPALAAATLGGERVYVPMVRNAHGEPVFAGDAPHMFWTIEEAEKFLDGPGAIQECVWVGNNGNGTLYFQDFAFKVDFTH